MTCDLGVFVRGSKLVLLCSLVQNQGADWSLGAYCLFPQCVVQVQRPLCAPGWRGQPLALGFFSGTGDSFPATPRAPVV